MSNPYRPYPRQGMSAYDAQALAQAETHGYPPEYAPYPPLVSYEQPGSPMQPQAHPSFREGQREHPEWDALRWGDADSVKGVATEELLVVNQQSKQLVRAHVPRPVVWSIQLQAGANVQLPPGEAANIVVVFAITLGCGQSMTTIFAPITLAPPYDSPNAQTNPPLTIPGQDVNIQAFVQYQPTVAGAFVIDVAAMAAPWAHVPFGEASERFATSTLQRR